LRGIWNSVWLGSKPAAQFLIGALLFASSRQLSGDFYNLLLVWSFGFAVGAALIDRQFVVLSHAADLRPGSVVRALAPFLIGTSAVVSLLGGPMASSLAGLPLWTAVATIACGGLSGVAEACFWAILADRNGYRALALLRVCTTTVFLSLVVLSLRQGGSLPTAFFAEAAALWLVGAALVRRDLQVPKAKVTLRGSEGITVARVLGFWSLTALAYLHQQLDFWWTSAALSRPELAAYRLGATPRSLLLLAMAAMLQPLLFRITSRTWRAERPHAEEAVRRTLNTLLAATSVYVVVSCLAVCLSDGFAGRFGDAIKVSWVLATSYAAYGWFGYLGSSVITNAGAIRLPIAVVITSLAARAAAYAVLMRFGKLSLPTLIAASEVLALGGQALFWKYISSKGIWRADSGTKTRLAARTLAAVAALAVAAATHFSPAGLLCMMATHVALGAHAAMGVRLKPDLKQLENAA
jgi:hypothetical protein